MSISRAKYYLVCLDDFTHYLWTFPLILKSETFSTLHNFHSYTFLLTSIVVLSLFIVTMVVNSTTMLLAHSFLNKAFIFTFLAPKHPNRTARPNALFGPPTISCAPCYFKLLCLLPIGSNPFTPPPIFSIYTPLKLFKIKLLIKFYLAHLLLMITSTCSDAIVILTYQPPCLINLPHDLPNVSLLGSQRTTKAIIALTSLQIMSSSLITCSLTKTTSLLIVIPQHL